MEGLDEGGARGRGGGVRSGVSAQGRGGGGRGVVFEGGGVARGWRCRALGVASVLLSGRLRVLLDSATDAAVGREVAILVMAGRSEVMPLAVRDDPPAADSQKKGLVRGRDSKK